MAKHRRRVRITTYGTVEWEGMSESVVRRHIANSPYGCVVAGVNGTMSWEPDKRRKAVVEWDDEEKSDG